MRSLSISLRRRRHERVGARAVAARFLNEARCRRRGPLLIVRANALDSGETDADLDAVMAGAPDAILLPGSLGRGERPAAFRQTRGARGRIRPRRRRDQDHRRRRHGAVSVQHGKLSRLERAAPGRRLERGVLARRYRRRDGTRPILALTLAPYSLARELTLLAATSARVAAIDAVFRDVRDLRACAPRRSPRGATALPPK